ncbi:AGAP000442-PA-like protein [Anopheles sinensis]|uniref:AGAP000442-PA-like protein n=1 Tax=Anopheles sinensis TaxID=74873 RepID=A0A084VX63_ANOSI|nr:AGAP000442-PA-like protein [Anopheles sinensis]
MATHFQTPVAEISSQILPKAPVPEEVRKPSHKIRRLKAIGNQIRFLRRLERSIHKKELPSTQQPEEDSQGGSGSAGVGVKESPKISSSPLIKFKQSQIDEEDESEEGEEDSKSTYFATALSKVIICGSKY